MVLGVHKVQYKLYSTKNGVQFHLCIIKQVDYCTSHMILQREKYYVPTKEDRRQTTAYVMNLIVLGSSLVRVRTQRTVLLLTENTFWRY
jgi:hypothetical protein